ncbi:MAG: hypothetical protein H6604_05210 [Flavobacteriales bacterium]|nr:hypothetical protein [Flavobacteriales bacterium]
MIYNAIINADFKKVEKNTIYVTFKSYSSQHEFQEIQHEFLDILRKKVQNFYIAFEYEIIEDKETKYILSREDIFKNMVEKNPKLLDLKDDLGLII